MRFLKFLFNTTHYIINYILAIMIIRILNLFKIKWKRNIWVIGGNGGQYYSDNSAVLHNYILNNYQDIEVYWVIEKASPDVIKAKEQGPILYKHSLKSNVYALLAKVLICNHSIRGDILRSNMKRFEDAFTVSLCHGVTAFKAKKSFPNTSKLDLLIATSDYEKEIKQNWMNGNDQNVVVTGFPRHDIIFDMKNKNNNHKNIFYMPTWREWIIKKWVDPSKEDFRTFRNSQFYKEINSFLSNQDLNHFLKTNNYIINIFFHKNLHPFIKEFFDNKYPSNINILMEDTNVQEQLLNSNLLITDYSSVAWDFLLLDRPTIFYQFDYELYTKYNKSYISIPEELFGSVTYSYFETIKLIKDFINDAYYEDESKKEYMKNKFLKFDDNQNCDRVMKAIFARL